MHTLLLTVIGDDRAGLVKALADTVGEHGGNWERSRLAELAGKFAGIVEVSVPDEQAGELRAALAGHAGLLEIDVHQGRAEEADAGPVVRLEVLGNDRSGIVREVSGALAAHGLSVDELSTETRDAPMAGGQLFEAKITAHAPPGTDLAAVRAALEALAQEIQVDVTVDA